MTDTNTEKLTSKLYQVTDRMDDQDPLKWRLRSVALEISELLFRSKYGLTYSEEQTLNSRRSFLFENINFLLEFASSQFHIARSNFETLQKEYSKIKEIKNPENREPINDSIQPKVETKNIIINEIEREITPEPFMRQNKIMDYLAERHVASIGELVVFFENSVSDKTLQRDLGELVAQGKVRADGEKRWRVYSLASA